MRCKIDVFFGGFWQFSAYFGHPVYFGLSSNRYFTAKTVKELFSDTSSDKIINFLKETNLFNKL